MSKYIVLLGDGMADEPCKSLGNQTPLQYANTPGMDAIVKRGVGGMVHTVPEGLSPGSDIANMGLLGYDPKQYYTGRGPIEAASLDIPLKNDEIVFRCNLTHVQNGLMKDFTANHVSTENATIILDRLNANCQGTDFQFYLGVSYRHILKTSNRFSDLLCCAPHDILDAPYVAHLPKGSHENEFLDFIHSCNLIIEKDPTIRNLDLTSTGPNFIWPWSPGPYPSLESFVSRTGLTGGIITAVDLLKGLARLTDLDAPYVVGATGFLDTNYENKYNAALDILENHPFVYVHVEAPDEAGHMGDPELKVKAIEDFDQNIVQRFLHYADSSNEIVHLMVLPDHPTPCHLKTHTSNPVPFGLFWEGIDTDAFSAYDEMTLSTSTSNFESPWELLTYFLGKNRNLS